MARKLKSDKMLFLATILLVALSIVMVYSASAPVALERYGRASVFLIKQAMWAAIGLPTLWVVMKVDYRTYREPVFIWTCLGLVGLGLVAVLFSAPVNNARRWFGMAGIGVQPSEFAKLTAIFFIAALLERRMHRIDDVKYSLVPIGIVVGALVGLILLEPDFGTSMSLLLIAAAMIFAAGLDYRYIFGVLLAMLPAVYIILMGASYRRRRLLAFLNPWDDPLGDGFQIIQSLIAVGTGGVWGKGLMNGVQKLFYLHLLGDFRGARAGRRDGGDRLLRDHHVARPARGHARAGQFRRLSRRGADDHDRRPGARQHQRGARPDADQGDPAAVRQCRRLVAADQSDRHGDSLECLAARLG
jgi:cell division protein FtsW